MPDQRDDITWVVLELSSPGEDKVVDGTLDGSIRRELGVGPDHPIFVPSCAYVKNGKRVVVNLIEGYAFVGSGLPETTYFKLEQTSYVEKVISSVTGPYKMRALSTVPNSHILKLRQKLQEEMASDLEVGMYVYVTDGIYRRLEGTVINMFADSAVIKIELRSKTLLATIPLSSLSSSDPSELE